VRGAELADIAAARGSYLADEAVARGSHLADVARERVGEEIGGGRKHKRKRSRR